MQRTMQKARVRSMPNGKVSTAAQRWFSANILRLAFALSTSLFGLVLHIMGAPERLAQALVALGIVYLLVKAGKPVADKPQNAPYGAIG
jgi:hypothetical protein